MNELIIAGLSGATVWFGLAAARRRDPVVASRIALITGVPEPAAAVRPVRSLLGRLGRSYPGTGGEATRELLAAAGMAGVPVESVRGLQLALGGLGFVAGLAFGAIAVVMSPVGVLVGYRLPHTALTSRSRRRRDEMAAALPDVVDLLAVCTHAGLNITLSLKRVAERAPGPLGREVRRVVEEMELGVPRSQALENLAARSRLPELESLVRVLLNSERFGTRISESLETFAADSRARRRRSAEEQARRAPVKILFPLVFLILPAFVLLSVVPLLVSAFEAMEF